MKTPIAWVLATGDELVQGALVDSNSAKIAAELTGMGLDVTRHVSLGDDLDRLTEALRRAGEQADIAVVTGGLGPTMDDLSSEAAAKAAGVELALDPDALAWIEGLFQLAGRKMNPSNKKQAYFPKGAERLDNPIGTAPGFAMDLGSCRMFFMPGVPREMDLMFREQVLPRVAKKIGADHSVFLTKNLTTFGSTESSVGEKVEVIPDDVPGLRVGLRAHFPEIQVKLYARADTEKVAQTMLDQGEALVNERVGRYVISDKGLSMDGALGAALAQAKTTVAVAESCTGGLIGHMLTNVSGSSDYFLASLVTYANQAKVNILGVSQSTLDLHGAVSEETVKEMAAGAKRVTGADWGLATSGIAGPTGGTDAKPVGTVCVGLAGPEGTEACTFRFPFERERNKVVFAVSAMDVLRRKILGLPPPTLPK